MKISSDIDFTKLLGFAAVTDQISGSVDFQNETIAAKLGAKVGAPEDSPVTVAAAVED
jgi:hypothetical protein